MLTYDIFSNEKEVWELYKIIAQMHLESPYPHYHLDQEYIYNLILDSRTKEKVFFLLRSEGQIVGYLYAIAHQHPFFPDIYTACEQSWYVLPEHRKQESWVLVDLYEEWAKTIGCKICTMANYNTPKLSEAYVARGYKHVEQSFIKELI